MYIRSEREEENKIARERERKRKCQLETYIWINIFDIHTYVYKFSLLCNRDSAINACELHHSGSSESLFSPPHATRFYQVRGNFLLIVFQFFNFPTFFQNSWLATVASRAKVDLRQLLSSHLAFVPTCGRCKSIEMKKMSPEIWSWPCGARQLGTTAPSPPRAQLQLADDKSDEMGYTRDTEVRVTR